jgi:hypothetical protein
MDGDSSSRNRGDGTGRRLGLQLRWRSAWLGAEEQGRAARVPGLGARYKGARERSPRCARHTCRGVVAAKLVSAMDTGEAGRLASAGQTGLERVRVGGGTGRALGLPVGYD